MYIKNRVTTRALKDGISPFEVFWGRKPDLGMLRAFGSPAYVHVPAELQHKLDPRCVPCLFVGYAHKYKAWRFLDLATGKEIVSAQARFNERVRDTTPSLTLLEQPQPADLQRGYNHAQAV